MEEKTIKMAEEIADLRERQGLTFKAIAELYQISSGRASYLYQDCLRRRRLARYNEIIKWHLKRSLLCFGREEKAALERGRLLWSTFVLSAELS